MKLNKVLETDWVDMENPTAVGFNYEKEKKK